MEGKTLNRISEFEDIDLGYDCTLENIEMKANGEGLTVKLSMDYPSDTDIVILCQTEAGETHVKSPFGGQLKFQFKDIPSTLNLRMAYSNEESNGILKEIKISNPEQPTIFVIEPEVSTDYLASIPKEEILDFVESMLCLSGDQNLSIRKLLEYSIGTIGSYSNAMHYAFQINKELNFADPGLIVLNTVTGFIGSAIVTSDLSRSGYYFAQEHYNALKDYAKENIADEKGNIDEYRVALNFVNDVLMASFKQLYISSPVDLQKAYLHYSQNLKPHLNIERNFTFGEHERQIINVYSKFRAKDRLINKPIDNFFNNDLDLEFGPITLIKTHAKDFHLAYLKEDNFSINFFHNSFEYYVGKFVNRDSQGKTLGVNVEVVDELNLELSRMDVSIADGKYRALLAVKSIIYGALRTILSSKEV